MRRQNLEGRVQTVDGRLLKPKQANKKSLLIELKRSNRRDLHLCEIIGMIAEIESNQYHFTVLV